jgi:protein O-mannosyl-transferase
MQLKEKKSHSPKYLNLNSKKKPVEIGFLKKNLFFIVLFAVTFLVFGNGIGNDYALDDDFYTAGGNKLTTMGVRGIPQIFKNHTFYNNDGTGYSYRPVALATFAIENSFFGENPHVSHFLSVLLYALCIVILFSLLRKWFNSQGNWFSFFICLLFLVHPLHTEVVDNIKCRDELLALFFILLTFHALWKYIETKKLVYLILYPILFTAGLLSKQTAIPFYFIIPLSIWFFADEKILVLKKSKIKKLVCLLIYLSFAAALFIAKKPSGFGVLGVVVFLWFASDRFWKIALYLSPLIFMTAISSYLQRHGLEPDTRKYLAFENPLSGAAEIWKLTATSFYVIGRYLFLHFIPHPLVYYYGSFYVPDVTWANPFATASIVIHCAIGLWAFVEFRKKTIVGFGLLFYLINIAAYSNLVARAPGIMAERFTFAASLGFCIVLVALVFRFLKEDPINFVWGGKRNDNLKKIKIILMVIVSLFAVRSFSRNFDWKNKEVLYGGDMYYLGESVKANMLFGAEISRRAFAANFESRISDGKGGVRINKEKQIEAAGLFTEARIYYKKAAELAPYYHTAWSNLGTACFFVGETKEALANFFKAVSIKPDYAEGWFNIGIAYNSLSSMDAGRKLILEDSAIFAFKKSIRSDSTYVQSYEQLSKLIIQHNNDTGAPLSLLRVAIKHSPSSEIPWNNMVAIYLQAKDTANSAAAMERAAVLDPNNIQRLYILAQYFKSKGNDFKYSSYMTRATKEKRKLQEKQKKEERKLEND